MQAERSDDRSDRHATSSGPPLDRSPLVEIANPTPSAARRAVVELARCGDLGPAAVLGLELAVSEIVTNAIVHGVAPVTLQAWLPSPSCVVVAVRDAGSGPSRPTGGPLPPAVAVDGGRGMWICRRSVARVDEWVDIDGYVVRLTASA